MWILYLVPIAFFIAVIAMIAANPRGIR